MEKFIVFLFAFRINVHKFSLKTILIVERFKKILFNFPRGQAHNFHISLIHGNSASSRMNENCKLATEKIVNWISEMFKATSSGMLNCNLFIWKWILSFRNREMMLRRLKIPRWTATRSIDFPRVSVKAHSTSSNWLKRFFASWMLENI